MQAYYGSYCAGAEDGEKKLIKKSKLKQQSNNTVKF